MLMCDVCVHAVALSKVEVLKLGWYGSRPWGIRPRFHGHLEIMKKNRENGALT